MKTLNITHMASHKINVGDGAIHNGTYSILKEISADLGIAININTFDAVGSAYDKDLINLEEISQGSDMIIIGGGGVIDGYAHLNTAIGYPILNDSILNSTKHITFLALGHNLFYGQTLNNQFQIQELLNICEKKDYGFSVRLDRSLSRLSNDVDVSTIVEIADPGMFIETKEAPDIYLSGEEKPLIIFQLTSEKYENRFGSKNQVELFFESISGFVKDLIVDYNILFATHTTMDLYCVPVVLGALNQSNIRFGISYTGIYSPAAANYFFNYYEKANVVVGMRGHSAICAYGLGVNFIGIDTHPKMAGFMQEYGKGYNCFTPFEVINDINFMDTVRTLASKKKNIDNNFLSIKKVERHGVKSFLLNEILKVLNEK